ncbi:hypothetical protein [Nocardia phage P3.1]|nr:hypothetical protein [Nocardia phage P3.1]
MTYLQKMEADELERPTVSGGSFNYLSTMEASELLTTSALEEMADFLDANAPGSRAADWTRKLVSIRQSTKELLEGYGNALEKVWHDAEWWQSGDMNREDFLKAVQEFEKKKVQNG